MSKNFSIEANSSLEVYFSCLALGWKDDHSFISRMKNPLLQVLYDDVTVFDLDKAIADNSGHYSQDKWNQFRLFSR